MSVRITGVMRSDRGRQRNYSSIRSEIRAFRRGRVPLEEKLEGRSIIRVEAQPQLQPALLRLSAMISSISRSLILPFSYSTPE
jgi:hypothetical protein